MMKLNWSICGHDRRLSGTGAGQIRTITASDAFN